MTKFGISRRPQQKEKNEKKNEDVEDDKER